MGAKRCGGRFDAIILGAFRRKPKVPRCMPIEAYRGVLPTLGRDVYVHASATLIGDIRLDDGVSVWPGVVIRADVNAIRIGRGTNLQDGCVLHVSRPRPATPGGAPLRIGAHVSVGHACILHGCEIGDECLIGMGALVMDHAVLEPQVLLGAGSLVTQGRRLRSGWLYVGRPARRSRRLDAEEIAGLRRQAEQYVALAAEYLAARAATGPTAESRQPSRR